MQIDANIPDKNVTCLAITLMKYKMVFSAAKTR